MATPHVPTVFLCHSSADRPTVLELAAYLKPFQKRRELDVWLDIESLRPSEEWDEKIQEALAASDIAVLFVSQDLLVSSYAIGHEVPRLLAASKAGKIKLAPLFVRHSVAGHPLLTFNVGDEKMVLTQLQGLNQPDRPISELAASERDKVMTEIAYKLVAMAKECAGKAARPEHGRQRETSPDGPGNDGSDGPAAKPSRHAAEGAGKDTERKHERRRETSTGRSGDEDRDRPKAVPAWRTPDGIAKYGGLLFMVGLAGFAFYEIVLTGGHREAAEKAAAQFVDMIATKAPVTSLEKLVDVPFFFGADILKTGEGVAARFGNVLENARQVMSAADEPRFESDALRLATTFVVEIWRSASMNRSIVDANGLDFLVHPNAEAEAEDPFLSPEIALGDYARVSIRLAGVPSATLESAYLYTVLDDTGAARIRGIKFR